MTAHHIAAAATADSVPLIRQGRVDRRSHRTSKRPGSVSCTRAPSSDPVSTRPGGRAGHEPEELGVGIRQEVGLRERESVKVGDTRLDSADVQLVEAVVPANSQLVGSTLIESDFQAATGLP